LAFGFYTTLKRLQKQVGEAKVIIQAQKTTKQVALQDFIPLLRKVRKRETAGTIMEVFDMQGMQTFQTVESSYSILSTFNNDVVLLTNSVLSFMVVRAFLGISLTHEKNVENFTPFDLSNKTTSHIKFDTEENATVASCFLYESSYGITDDFQ
jgi:ribosomal protein S1